MQRFIKSVFLFFLGFVFIFSAVAKMVPIEFFEFQVADIVNTSWRNVQVISRIIICMEFSLGVLLMLHVELEKFTLPFAFLVLISFTLLLSIQYVLYGNQENCGCFGDKVEMTTLQGIGKNVFLLLITAYCYKVLPQWGFHMKMGSIIAPILFTLIAVIPANMIKPINWGSVTDQSPATSIKSYEPLYDTSLVDKVPSFDYKQGKHIIIFSDPTCKHCQLAASKAAVMKRQDTSLPFLIVLNGDESDIKNYNEITQSDNIEKIQFKDGLVFILMAESPGLPSINWINNGNRDYQTVHYEMRKEDIEKWLNQK